MLRIALATCALFAALIISIGMFDSTPAQAGGYDGGYGGYGGYGGCHTAYIPYGWTWYRASNC